jgi:hypothetical protein
MTGSDGWRRPFLTEPALNFEGAARRAFRAPRAAAGHELLIPRRSLNMINHDDLNWPLARVQL